MILTVFRGSFSCVCTPVAPVAVVLSGIFAAHLSDINCVWSKVLQSEGQNVLGSVCERYLENKEQICCFEFVTS